VTNDTLSRQSHLSKIFAEIISNLDTEEVFNKRGRPYTYSTKSVIKAFLIMVSYRLTSARSLARFLGQHPEIAKVCGFRDNRIPSYRTFCRRFSCLDNWVLQWCRIILTFLVDNRILNLKMLIIDATPCKSKCKKPRARKMSMPSDPEAAFGYTGWEKDWFFGYKAVILATAEPLVVPLSWTVIPGNQQEVKHLIPLVGKASWLLGDKHELLGDSGFDSTSNYQWSRELKIRFTCPLKLLGRPRKDKIGIKLKGKRLKRQEFFKSDKGQKLYHRRTDIERLNGHLKELFLIDPLPVRRLRNVKTYLSLTMLCYLAAVYYNYTQGRKLRHIKSLIA